MKLSGLPIKALRRALGLLLELLVAPLLVAFCGIARISRKPIDVGLGPEPLVNNVHHKEALVAHGFSVETFVNDVYYITDKFDVRGDLMFRGPIRFFFSRRLLVCCYLFMRAVWRYRVIYIYFNGGPLGLGTMLLRPLEPWLFRLAGTRVVVMPYGGDIQDMTRPTNLLFKHAVATDYPRHRLRRKATARQIDRWTRHADHVIAGCDWVDYLYHWDTLMLAHFSIDTRAWASAAESSDSATLRILHAPNHRSIKGSPHFVRAIKELREEGVDVELVVLERVGNDRIREVMASVDVVADQLVIGWYAMFAIEAMSMGKAVLCYLRPDLIALYEDTELVAPGEIPIVSCTPSTVKEQIRLLAEDRNRLQELQKRGPEFVRRHHSIEAVGAVLARVNRGLGIEPRGATS